MNSIWKRTLPAAACLVVLAFALAGANSHGSACGAGFTAGVELEGNEDGSLTYRGVVHCPNATSITITDLELRVYDPLANLNDYTLVEETSGSCSGSSCVLEETSEPQAPGFYRVVLRFGTTGTTPPLSNQLRTGSWVWLVAADPVKFE